MRAQILPILQHNKKHKHASFAVLLDPDKVELSSFPVMLAEAVAQGVDFFFVGGSLITRYATDEIIAAIHTHTNIPAILFPGNSLHIEPSADAILFLSLISGRNADLLIGQQVVAAPLLKRSTLEILPTGYMLVESGRATTVSYISNTTPIPHDKPSVAACTAMAGEMLGLQLMYLDAGSGAQKPVSAAMIAAVSKATNTPIIVGGGINTPEKALAALEAGANVIVVGNGIEQNPELLPQIAQAVKAFNEQLVLE
jgi:phosphoglycerol geranylgeranyltransferase